MKILTRWLRAYLPAIPVSDRELADDLTLRGIAVEGVHDLGTRPDGHTSGHLFEMDITTNRVDAMNHYGIAREAAAIYNLPLPSLVKDPTSSVAQTPHIPNQTPDETPNQAPPIGPQPPFSTTALPSEPPPSLPVEIETSAQHLCGRFTARILHNITVSSSIGTIAENFSLLGQKLISTPVDASNFTLLGMGHPTHAFDLDKITGGIVVRLAHPGEKLVLLDGAERALSPDDLVIADHRRALSLAGVMGGLDSAITAGTQNVLVESAWFDPATIRRSARRHGLHTDASHRFERGADFNAAPVANHLVSALILENGGTAHGGLIDVKIPALRAQIANRPPVTLALAEVHRHLGATVDDIPGQSALTPALIRQYLTALGCTVSPAPGATFTVHLPSWRLDLTRPIDLIEEIARVFGYNRFSNTLPPPLLVREHPFAGPDRAVRNRLLALGFSEAISSTFTSPAETQLFPPEPTAGQGSATTPVPLENPLSEDAAYLRPSLLPGMISMLAGNLHRDTTDVRLFEQGNIFSTVSNLDNPDSPDNPLAEVLETPSLALGLTTAKPLPTALHTAPDAPIFELKGAIESLAGLFALPGGSSPNTGGLTFTTDAPPAWLEPGRSATALLHRRPLAHFGELSAAERDRRKLRQPVFLATLDLAALYALPLRRVTAHELSRFPAVDRDFSFTFPDTLAWHTVAAAIHALSIPELQSLTPIEIFRDPKGSSVPPAHYALLLRCVFQSLDRTLRDDELTLWWSSIIATLTGLGGTIRAPV